jgi:hypothetical protein
VFGLRTVEADFAQVAIHVRKPTLRPGIDIVAVFRVTPGGNVPSMMTSVGIVITLRFPLPVFHSPKATVLLDPSMRWVSPIGEAAPHWKTPLGGPPVNADFRGRENNQAFGGRTPRFFGDFFIPVPRSLIIFPAQRGSVGYVSAFAES